MLEPYGGILADEMGLGKTVQMIALALRNRPPEETPGVNAPLRNLVVVPASLLHQWKSEILSHCKCVGVVGLCRATCARESVSSQYCGGWGSTLAAAVLWYLRREAWETVLGLDSGEKRDIAGRGPVSLTLTWRCSALSEPRHTIFLHTCSGRPPRCLHPSRCRPKHGPSLPGPQGLCHHHFQHARTRSKGVRFLGMRDRCFDDWYLVRCSGVESSVTSPPPPPSRAFFRYLEWTKGSTLQLRPDSPLPAMFRVHWHRIILDEASYIPPPNVSPDVSSNF